MAMTAKLWTISGLAAELGRDRRLISAALKGIPHDGKDGRYKAWHMTTVLEALDGGDVLDLTTERARLAKAQADDREMKNALQRGEMMTTASYNLLMTASFGRVRSKLPALPSKMAPLMVGTKEAADAQGKLQEVIYNVLDELAATRIAGVSEDGGIIEDRP